MLNKIKDIKNKFSENLEDINYKYFSATKEVLFNFKEIFNPKNIFIASLFISSNAMANENIDLIDKVFNESIKVQSIHYNKDLPEYFINKNSIESNKKDTTLKNDFWEGNVSTLVFGDVDNEFIPKKESEIQHLNSLNRMSEPAYLNRFNLIKLEQKDVNDFFNGKDTYHHFMKNEGNLTQFIINTSKQENHKYIKDFITYHEMAHSSYEQNITKYKNFISLDFNISEEVKFETHSDIAGLLMTAKKNGLNYDEFKSLSLDVAKFRALYTKENLDFGHNSALAIIDLIHNLDDNQYIYNTMAEEKISSFSAFYVSELNKSNSKDLLSILNKSGIPTDIDSLVNRITDLKDKIKESGTDNFNGSQFFYFIYMQEEFYKRNPEAREELVSLSKKNSPFDDRYIKKVGENNLKLSELTEQDIMIYAVNLNKTFKTIDYNSFSTSFTQVLGENVNKFYKKSLLANDFEENKSKLEKSIKYN